MPPLVPGKPRPLASRPDVEKRWMVEQLVIDTRIPEHIPTPRGRRDEADEQMDFTGERPSKPEQDGFPGDRLHRL